MEARPQCMMCDLLRPWDTIRRYSSRLEEIALLFMKLRETLRRATVILISFTFTKIKTRRTDLDRLRCADSYLYTRHAVRAYDTHSSLITSQPPCTGKEQFISLRITRG